MVESQQVWIQYQTIPNLKDSEVHEVKSSEDSEYNFAMVNKSAWLQQRYVYFPSQSCPISSLNGRLIPFTWVKNMDRTKFNLKA